MPFSSCPSVKITMQYIYHVDISLPVLHHSCSHLPYKKCYSYCKQQYIAVAKDWLDFFLQEIFFATLL